jgi:hypothetical protein
MSCETIAYYVGTTSFVDFLFVDEDGDRIDDANVTVTLLDEDDEEVAGATWPLAADPLEDNADYNYRVILPADLEIDKNERVTAEIYAVNPANNYELYTTRTIVGTMA